MEQYNEPIAIIGMSCRYPNAANLEEFWKLMIGGVDATGTIPFDRWNQTNYPFPIYNSCKSTNAGFLSVPVDVFDANFFGISPKEATFMDPQTRLLLELVWEGLEDSGIDPTSLHGTNGAVFLGSWLSDWRELLLRCPGYDEFYRRYMGNSIGSAAARISFHLGMTGPSIATESGCSSSMVAVQLACKSLQQNECELALACGVNLLLKPFDKFEMPVMLSPEGRCKTFDASANGFGRAEGVGVLVLKRLKDAERNENRIWGVIRGCGMSQEGLSKSMGTPTVYSETLAMKLALKDAGITDPALVTYVEAHGTGTQVGDPMEIKAIAEAYHSERREVPLYVGSVKTNVGHTESCSGITGIMKVVLAMKHGIIPPNINLKNLNPAINFDIIPAKIPVDPVEWTRVPGKSRIAGVSSFGITGTDTHVIIEEPPICKGTNTYSENKIHDRPKHLIKISAKSEQSLEIFLEKYKNHCKISSDSLANIAYTSNNGRASFDHRAVIIAKSNEQVVKCIEDGMHFRNEPETGVAKTGKICFLFTGQGSQYQGMARSLYDTNPIFQQHFEYCSNLLKNNYQIDIKKVLWEENDLNQASQTIYSQPGIFCVQYALIKLWESWGVKPDFVLGHSLGEFAAAACAGILTVENAFKLMAERSRLIEALPPGKMMAIQSNKETVSKAMVESKTKLDFAAYNSPNQTVVAGDSKVIEKFHKYLTEGKGINLKSTILKSTHAFHSRHMNPILEKYYKIAGSVVLEDGENLECGYISGLEGKLVDRNKIDPYYWVRHCREPVSFMNACKTAQDECQLFVEIGPQPVLSSFVMANNTEEPKIYTCLPSLRKGQDEWTVLLNSLAQLYLNGIQINWKGFDQCYSRQLVRIPHYPFMGKQFWPQININNGNSQLISGGSLENCHPLLGREIANASSTKLFENELNMEFDERLKFIGDHKIGKNVIFPGAAYLEMSVSAFNKLSGGSLAVKIENLTILAPLALGSLAGSPYIQTIMERGTETCKQNVKFVRKINSEKIKWITQAKATVFVLKIDKEIPKFDIKLLIQMSEFRPILPFYNRIFSSEGLNFGENFQSIENYWEQENPEDKGKWILVKVKRISDTHENNFYCSLHPIVLDAMIQALMIFAIGDLPKTRRRSNKILVPVKIGFFEWINEKNRKYSDELYVYVFTEELDLGKPTVKLVDGMGAILATMSSVEFVETTVKSLETVLESQLKLNNEIPGMWEVYWKKQNISPIQYRLDLKILSQFWNNFDLKENIKMEFFQAPSNIVSLDKNLLDLVYFYILNTLYTLGWKPEVGECYEIGDLVVELNIKEDHLNYLEFMIQVLVERGTLEKNELSLRVVIVPELTSIMPSGKTIGKMAEFLTKIGRNLANILTGEMNPLQIHFPPEGEDTTSVSTFYDEYSEIYGFAKLASTLALQKMEYCAKHFKNKFVLRILEVGAGTGGYTKILLDVLDCLSIDYEYTYTDISSSYFPTAEKKFEKYRGKMRFLKLNIEEDPLEQERFVPEYFDMVLAYEVIHTTRNISESLKNIRLLLKPGGILELGETTRMDAHYLTFLFGLLPGYWRFEDKEIRPKCCLLNSEKWKMALELNGFEVDGTLACYFGNSSVISSHRKKLEVETQLLNGSKTWLIFEDGNKLMEEMKNKLLGIGRHVICIVPCCDNKEDFQKIGHDEKLVKLKIDSESDFKIFLKQICEEKDIRLEGILYGWALEFGSKNVKQSEILQPFFYLTKYLNIFTNGKSPVSITVLTNGYACLENSDLSNYQSSTIWGFARSLMNESSDAVNCRCVDIENSGMMIDEQYISQLVFYELFNKNENEPQVAYHDWIKYCLKLGPLKSSKITGIEDLEVPKNCANFNLALPQTKSIADLKFEPSPINTNEIGETQVEIFVKCVALNFRDILSVLKPTEEFQNLNTVGIDICGEIMKTGDKVTQWKVGDFVFGLNMKQDGPAMPSNLKIDETSVVSVPSSMTFCEAVTLPAVFATAYKCLIEIANLKSSDKILIHTASGGVGLVAIDICKNVVPLENIFVTAGTPRKRAFLRNIGIQHVYNSRDTKYSQEILNDTNGQGVDIVLNSLTSEGFKEATVKACAKNARFVEMSKLSIWTLEEVKEIRPDLKYTIFNITDEAKNDIHAVMKKLEEFIEMKIVKPLPYLRFDAVKIRQGMEYFQKAKHIGKVVIMMPEISQSLDEDKRNYLAPLFNNQSTYLITGGLGGIGFEVAKWMLKQGGKYVILGSRNLPKLEVVNEIKDLNRKYTANIITIKFDVGCFNECRSVILNQLSEMGYPPLRGIMHCAGILADGLIVNQNWENLSAVFKAKIDGTLNLHELTKNLNLEHFVLFSSFATQLGSPGQSNHSAGNQFMDSFAHYRHSIGLPATTINWGNWCEVGVATGIDFCGVRPMTNREGLAGLEHVMRNNRLQTLVANLKNLKDLSGQIPQLFKYLDDAVLKSIDNNKGTENNGKYFKEKVSEMISSAEFWKQYNLIEDESDQMKFLKQQVRFVVGNVIRLSVDDPFFGNQIMFEALGVDSLMFVEIKNGLQSLLGQRVIISESVIRERNNVDLISEIILQQIKISDAILNA